VGCLVAFTIISPLAVVSLASGLPLHIYGHKERPFISLIDQSHRVSPLSQTRSQLDMRSYNLGFTYECTSVLGDLRSPVKRAQEITKHIIEEEQKPDIICFQEAFHLDATKILCNGIKEHYPFIIHNVAPHVMGLCSGLVIASRYPIEEVFFRRFTDLIGPESLTTRGLLGLRIKLGQQAYANVYNTHLQAILGKERAQIRLNQLQKIVNWIDEDTKHDQMRKDHRLKIGDFLMGDLNFSVLDLQGRRNISENPFRSLLQKHFVDAFLKEHDELTGKRLQGRAHYVPSHLEEPCGSVYTGLQASDFVFKIKELFEKIFYGFKAGEQIKNPNVKASWGTPDWSKGSRDARVARYDFQLLKRPLNPLVNICGTAEIEHISNNTQSGSSDHLPIRAIYQWNYS